MTEQQKTTADSFVNSLEETVKLPENYYFYGDPAGVIDRVDQLVKLNGDLQIQDQRQQLAREILSFCPVPFLDELIIALELKNQEVVEKLKIKASRQEINLIHRSFNEEEKKQISALASKLLIEKIVATDSEKLLPILRFVQKYILVQIKHQNSIYQEITNLNQQKDQLSQLIQAKEAKLMADRQAIFFEFIGKLSNSDF
jgi:hypothetical protein